MPIEKLELRDQPPVTPWLALKLIPKAQLSTIFAPAGIGKTRMIAYLTSQIVRPAGRGLFLGHPVQHGRVLILDADDPSGFGYMQWLPRFLNAYDDAERDLIDLRNITGGLQVNDLETLKKELSSAPPQLIVLDTFASAFIGLDTIKGHLVQAALTALADLAKELGSSVITLDHVGKLKQGETVASRGPYGSAKTFSPRAVFALSRVPPKEVDGRDVLRMDCTKMSYAAVPAPKGVEIILSPDEAVAQVKLAELPHATQLDAAIEAIRVTLLSAQGEPMPRKALISAAVQSANITKRYAETAMAKFLKEFARQVEVVELGGKGSPKGLVWVGGEFGKSDFSDGDAKRFAERVFSVDAGRSGNDEVVIA